MGGKPTLRLYAVLLIALQLLPLRAAYGDDSPGSTIFYHYSHRAAHVETTAVMPDGSVVYGHGSGFLITNSLVVTNKHVVPEHEGASIYIVKVRLSSKMLDPLIVGEISRSEREDVAVLRLKGPAVVDAPCPVSVYESLEDMGPGDEIFVLGYPLNQDLSISSGIISNKSDPHRWQTDTLFNKGSSGGPVFSREGAFVGIAVGGVVCWPTGADNCHDVDGVNFFIPGDRVLEASSHNELNWDHLYNHACWADTGGDLPPQTPSETLSRAFAFSRTKDDHPVAFGPHSRVYGDSLDDILRPEPGYRLTACSPQPSSANNAHDVTCNIFPGGEKAQFRVRLKSGPAIDQWRGWWTGTIILEQERL